MTNFWRPTFEDQRLETNFWGPIFEDQLLIPNRNPMSLLFAASYFLFPAKKYEC